MKKIVQCLVISLPLFACGGGSGGSSTETPSLPPQVNTDYTKLKHADSSNNCNLITLRASPLEAP